MKEMFRVYESRDNIPEEGAGGAGSDRQLVTANRHEEVCLTATEYHVLIGAVIIGLMLLIFVTIIAGICFRWSIATIVIINIIN